MSDSSADGYNLAVLRVEFALAEMTARAELAEASSTDLSQIAAAALARAEKAEAERAALLNMLKRAISAFDDMEWQGRNQVFANMQAFASAYDRRAANIVREG